MQNGRSLLPVRTSFLGVWQKKYHYRLQQERVPNSMLPSSTHLVEVVIFLQPVTRIELMKESEIFGVSDLLLFACDTSVGAEMTTEFLWPEELRLACSLSSHSLIPFTVVILDSTR